MAEFTAVYSVEKQFSKNEFLRQVFISLSADAQTPVDVLSADFCEVEEYREQVIGLSAKVTVDFSCSLGYDREEEYLTLEKYRDNGVERQRQVVKTRTVTDWSPYHTVETFDTVAYALNRSASVAKYDSDESEICGEAVNACIEQMTSTDGEYEVEISALARARSVAETEAYVRLNIPSAKYKNESAHYDTELVTIECFDLPVYRVRYRYEGNDYYAEGFAVGAPSYSFGNRPQPEISTDDAAKNSTKKLKRVSLAAYISAAVMGIVGVFLVQSDSFGTLSIKYGSLVGGCLLGAAALLLIAGIFCSVMRNKKIKSVIESVKREKLCRLEKTLEKHGFQPYNAKNNIVG